MNFHISSFSESRTTSSASASESLARSTAESYTTTSGRGEGDLRVPRGERSHHPIKKEEGRRCEEVDYYS